MTKLMRKGFKKAASNISAISETTTFSVFEDFTPDNYGKTEFTSVEKYEGISSTARDGNESVKKFRSTIITNRLNLREGQTFNVYLAYNDVENDADKRVIRISFTRNEHDEEIAELSVHSTENKIYAVRDLLVDSDDEEGLIRLTKDGDWNSRTYAILDFNKNLSVNKYIYLTLNVPFAYEMNEAGQHTVSHASENYYVVKNMYLVLMTKDNTKEQCHLYKINTGKIEGGIIGFQVNSNKIKKIGLYDNKNKLILGYDNSYNGTVIIPPKSFFLEGIHENVCTNTKVDLSINYHINPSTYKFTIPTGLQ